MHGRSVASDRDYRRRAVAPPLPSSLSHHTFASFCIVSGFVTSFVSHSNSLGFRPQARCRGAGVSVAASGGGKLETATAYLARKNRFLAIPMIFLQVVQLLSQACCLPLPELLNVKNTVK